MSSTNPDGVPPWRRCTSSRLALVFLVALGACGGADREAPRQEPAPSVQGSEPVVQDTPVVTEPVTPATPTPTPTAPPAGPPDSYAGYNVVVVLVDTLRADALGLYGCDRPTSPNIDRRASQWQLFERCSSAAPWTLPSVSALFTSRHVFDHAVADMGDHLRAEVPVLAEVLSDAGYRTAAFTTNPFVGSRSGLDRGFENLTSKEGNEHCVDLDEVEKWIRDDDPRPFFAYLHSTEPHRPYRAPSVLGSRFPPVAPAQLREVHQLLRQFRLSAQTSVQSGSEGPAAAGNETTSLREVCDGLLAVRPQLQSLYDAGVAWADSNFENLLTRLDRLGIAERTLVLFLSDHGEEFSDHGTWMHSQSLYEELLHVPMLWRLPGVPGTRIAEPASLLDVTPTLLDLLGIEADVPAWSGRSWKARMRGEDAGATDGAASVRVIANRFDPGQDFASVGQERGQKNVALRLGSLKAIWTMDSDRLELYDLAADPHESHDLAAEDDPRVPQIREAAELWLSSQDLTRLDQRNSAGSEADLTPRQRRRLIELGYLDPRDGGR